jgi:Glycosyl hydrolases family 35
LLAGGFQIWGDDPRHPSDYYWGRTARDVAYQTLKWFARGGAHLNYYMFWGGSNFGRAAAAGIANMYASDAALCPSGQRRQPKFDHLAALHEALAEAAPVLLKAPTALHQNRSAQVWNGTSWGDFERENFTVFRYVVAHHHTSHHHEAVFVENNSDRDRRVRVKELRNRIVAIKARSSVLFLDGTLRFDSGQLASSAISYKRTVARNPVPLTNWSWWTEEGYENYLSFHPLEQTALMVQARRSSDYAWYSTSFDTIPELASVDNRNADSLNVSGRLTIQTQQANGIVAYLDGIPLGSADTNQHKEGNVTLYIPIPQRLAHTILTRPRQLHNVGILSESFGHGNLIGCFGVNNTRAKTKGITGNVDLVLEWHDSGPDAPIHRSTVRLTDGTFVWGSMAGLNRGPTVVNSLVPDGSERGSASALPRAHWRRRRLKNELLGSHPPRSATDDDGNSYRIGGMWSSVTFPTPSYEPDRQGLFVEVVWGRGHFWLNGVDMGRYWNITSSTSSSSATTAGSRAPPFYTQRYYFLPRDLLVDPTRSAPNVLEFFDALGWPDADYFDGRHRPRLVLSWIEPSHYTSHAFDDAVGYQDACLY